MVFGTFRPLYTVASKLFFYVFGFFGVLFEFAFSENLFGFEISTIHPLGSCRASGVGKCYGSQGGLETGLWDLDWDLMARWVGGLTLNWGAVWWDIGNCGKATCRSCYEPHRLPIWEQQCMCVYV